MTAMSDGHDLVPLLAELRSAVAEARFDLAGAGAEAARQARDGIVQQIDDYLLPRLRSLDAPLLAVVGGSTGAGKSTLVNSLLKQNVTAAGVLRPTTRAPVLVCHPEDGRWFDDDRVLPRLARTTGVEAGPGTLHLVESEGLPPGLAIIDAPDIDSVVSANRDLAVQLLAAADLWIFLTTAARYADSVPWDMLSSGNDRDAVVAVVLDRVPPEALDEVREDLTRMLVAHGMDDALIEVIEETTLEDGRLPESQVASLREGLAGLARNVEARSGVIRATLQGALAELERKVDALASAIDAQRRAAAELRESVDSAYSEAWREIDDAVRDGTLLRGEVLARWEEFVGTGELMRNIQARVGHLRDRVRAAVTGRPSAAAGVQEAVETGVEALIRAAADRAASRSVAAWRQSPAGRSLLAERERELARASAVLLQRLPREVRDWQGSVLELVRKEGADKRSGARIASYTLNGAGLAVMLTVFAHTGGLTGAEVAVAGGTSAASQKLMEAVFGDQAVRTLARTARQELLERTGRMLEDDARRFRSLLDVAAPPQDVGKLRKALSGWQAARASEREDQ